MRRRFSPPGPVTPRRRADRIPAGVAKAGPTASGRKSPAARSRERPHERDFVPICGLPAVQALFARDPARVERLFFEPRFAAALAGARRLMARTRRAYREVAPDELARIAGTVRHGGVVAVARPRPPLPFDPGMASGWARENRPVLVLDGIGNPHNLGAILRSAAYFGVAHAILAERPEQALPSASSYRVAEGALEHLLLYRATLPEAIEALRRSGFRRGRDLPWPRRSRSPICSEAKKGRSRWCSATRNTASSRPRSPCATSPSRFRGDPGQRMSEAGGVQSLNVAAAAAILLYVLTSR